MKSSVHLVKTIALTGDLDHLVAGLGFLIFHDFQIELFGELFNLRQRIFSYTRIESQDQFLQASPPR